MSYSDESASSLTPFNGDPTGDIFASQDVVARSPLTSTRVVETQSGFLIVVKDVPEKERLSLSVKRQIGTPPTSNILMTMDESKKLSHILFQAPDAQEQMQVPNHLRETSDRIAQAPTYGYADRPDAVPYTGMQSPYSTQPELDTYASTSNNPPTIDEMRTPYRVRRGGSNQKTRTTYNAEAILDYFSNVKKRQLAIGGVALVAVVGIVIGAVALIAPSSNKAKRDKEIAQTTGVNAVDPVDSFARSFVTNLLDFNPSTYRVSQIKAMAVMEPELMERHWQETKFPLSKRTLSNLPEGQQVVIDKVSKEATSSSSYDVEIRGSVTSPGKDSSPLALKLEISKTLDGQFLVTGQKDLSSTEVQTKSDAASSSTSTDQEQTESTKKKASIDLSNAANLTPESESSSRATTTADASSTEVTSADPLTQE
ncbi:MAG: hypothetical protein IPG59_05435 [Candidatus Melainabacteria bacterium]|nr:MAG: hypothetical protein IPG59_05435 [Candidatus Melainabacteria bacterium]